jgi:hypothetical protein
MWSIRGRRGRISEELHNGFWDAVVTRFLRADGKERSRRRRLTTFRISQARDVSLVKSELYVVEHSKYCRIACRNGAAWVTCQNRPCDYILKAGESLVLRGEGKTIVSGGREHNSIHIRTQ